MSAVATHGAPAPDAYVEKPQTDGPAMRAVEAGGATLEDIVLGVWEDLAADRVAACPVCGGSMSARAGCSGCGAELT